MENFKKITAMITSVAMLSSCAFSVSGNEITADGTAGYSDAQKYDSYSYYLKAGDVNISDDESYNDLRSLAEYEEAYDTENGVNVLKSELSGLENRRVIEVPLEYKYNSGFYSMSLDFSADPDLTFVGLKKDIGYADTEISQYNNRISVIRKTDTAEEIREEGVFAVLLFALPEKPAYSDYTVEIQNYEVFRLKNRTSTNYTESGFIQIGNVGEDQGSQEEKADITVEIQNVIKPFSELKTVAEYAGLYSDGDALGDGDTVPDYDLSEYASCKVAEVPVYISALDYGINTGQVKFAADPALKFMGVKMVGDAYNELNAVFRVSVKKRLIIIDSTSEFKGEGLLATLLYILPEDAGEDYKYSIGFDEAKPYVFIAKVPTPNVVKTVSGVIQGKADSDIPDVTGPASEVTTMPETTKPEVTEATTTIPAETTTTAVITTKPAETTTTAALTTKPAEITTTAVVTTKPAETTTTAVVTTKPAETTTTAVVTTKPAETTTTAVVTTKPAETTTTAVITTKPAETTTTAAITTKPAETTTTAVITTKPAETTTTAAITTKPAETTTTAVVTTKPAETTTTAVVTTKPAETTTTAVVTTKPAEVTTTSVETTKPAETTTTAVVTTKPAETTPAPNAPSSSDPLNIVIGKVTVDRKGQTGNVKAEMNISLLNNKTGLSAFQADLKIGDGTLPFKCTGVYADAFDGSWSVNKKQTENGITIQFISPDAHNIAASDGIFALLDIEADESVPDGTYDITLNNVQYSVLLGGQQKKFTADDAVFKIDAGSITLTGKPASEEPKEDITVDVRPGNKYEIPVSGTPAKIVVTAEKYGMFYSHDTNVIRPDGMKVMLVSGDNEVDITKSLRISDDFTPAKIYDPSNATYAYDIAVSLDESVAVKPVVKEAFEGTKLRVYVVRKGDISLDGEVDTRDGAYVIQTYNASRENASEENEILKALSDAAAEKANDAENTELYKELAMFAADVNADGTIDTRDSSLIIQFYNDNKANEGKEIADSWKDIEI